MKKTRIILLVLLVMIGLLLFYSAINTTSLWDNDESTYAEISKEMLKSGNWMTPTFNNEPWFCHPPLYMWLTATAFKTLGWNELTARFFPSLFAILGMLMLFKFAATWWDEKRGFVAAVVLGTSLQYLIQGGMATMDTMLNTFLLLAFYSAWRGFAPAQNSQNWGHVPLTIVNGTCPPGAPGDHAKQSWWFVFFFACALATLTKGIFGLAYPIFIFALYLGLTGQNSRWREVPWKAGLAIYAAIAAPWFIYETWRHGTVFLYQVFYFYTFKRVVSPILHQAGPWYYYFPVLFLGFFPWSGFLPTVLLKTWQERKNPKIMFLGVWIGATFVFFTLVNTKLPNYIFFLYPPLALLLAYFWGNLSKKQVLAGSAAALVLVGFLMAGIKIFAIQKLLPEELDGNLHKLWPILGILVLGTILTLFTRFWAKTNRVAFSTLVAMMCLFWLVLHFQFSKIVETYKPMKPLAQDLRVYRTKIPAPVLAYHVPGTASLIFYTDAPIINVNDPVEFMKLWRTEKLYCFIEDKTLIPLEQNMRPYWSMERKRTIWLLANFNPSVESRLNQPQYGFQRW